MLLAERAARGRGADVDVVLPVHLSTSALVALAEDSARFTLDLRRPMPTPPALSARRGTAFHAWVEEHYARAAFVDIDELPGSADDGAVDGDLAALRASFSASEWADRTPVEVEGGRLGSRTFDDAYCAPEAGAPFGLAGGGRRIEGAKEG